MIDYPDDRQNVDMGPGPDVMTDAELAAKYPHIIHGTPDPHWSWPNDNNWDNNWDNNRDNTPQPAAARIIDGHDFLFAERPNVAPVWGHEDGEGAREILWAGGEPLILAGSTGVGKTTILLQLIRGRLGLDTQLLGWPVRPGARNCLYFAADRPNQIAKAFRRHTDETENVSRLKVVEGPPPFSIVENPAGLVELANQADADTVVIDSLKDFASNLSDEQAGAAINHAFQLCCAAGIEVVGSHHSRKASGENKKPNTIDDVYGSGFITAGAGSVVFLYGRGGDSEVELIHLKQPESKVVGVGDKNVRLVHDHDKGRSAIIGQFDPLQLVAMRGDLGVSVSDAAKAETKALDPSRTQIQTARRKLERLVDSELASKTEPQHGGNERRGVVYYITELGTKTYEKQRSERSK